MAATDHADPDSTPANNNPAEDDRAAQTITPQSVTGATIIIVNGDGPGEGFNDGTPVSPVGGNPGTTLGAQRLNAFQAAADIWGGLINSDIDIHVLAKFDPLTCSSFSAVLGSAGPTTVDRDFPGAPVPDTWYPAALANTLSGRDGNGSQQEIRATFNSSIDNNNNCLSNKNWYYGLDGNAGSNIDLVTVLLHEFGHGLGFLTLVNGPTGQKFMGRDDIYMRNLEDHSTGKRWHQMSDTERRISAVDGNDLHWLGESVRGGSGHLSAGVNAQGHVQMFAPNPYQSGSSVSHFNTTLSPNELMEPFNTGVIHDPKLAVNLMTDIGWPTEPKADLSLSLTASDPQPDPGETITLSLTVVNGGPGRAGGIEVTRYAATGLTLLSQDRAAGKHHREQAPNVQFHAVSP